MEGEFQEHGCPIHQCINRGDAFEGENIKIVVQSPPSWETFESRVQLADPIRGCLEAGDLHEGQGDYAVVRFRLGTSLEKDQERSIRLPIFMAHLCDPALIHTWAWLDADDDEDEAPSAHVLELRKKMKAQELIMDEMYTAGTWTGTLIWDSSVQLVEYILQHRQLKAQIKGATVVELGCGLGLPGFLCQLLGAQTVALTDRGLIADMCQRAIDLNGLSGMVATRLEWADGAASAVVNDHLEGRAPDFVIACDCVFERLWNDFLLLTALRAVAGPDTACLVAVERRLGDGMDRFLLEAEKTFDVEFLWALDGDMKKVVLYRLKLLAQPDEPREGGRAVCDAEHFIQDSPPLAKS